MFICCSGTAGHFRGNLFYNLFKHNQMKFLLLLMLAGWTLAINVPCLTTQQCPINAYCLSSDMCACNTGYIGDCSTNAYFLTSSSIPLTLSPIATTFVYVSPQELDTFIQFTYQICLNQATQVMTTLTLWGETGNIIVFDLADTLGNPTSATLTSGCQQFITPYISFGSQPNGQNQMLVMGITSSLPANITIGVTQQEISGFFVYYYILVSIVVVVVVVIIVGVSVFLIRRRRRNLAEGIVPAVAGPAFNNIEHFQNFMPNFIAEALGSQKVVCAICLQQIEFTETVRQTPCKHIFHSNCIDSWCLKNLTCPVCRTDLTLQNIADGSRRSSCINTLNDRVFFEQTQIVPEQINVVQPSVEVSQEPKSHSKEDERYINFDEGKYQIRQHML